MSFCPATLTRFVRVMAVVAATVTSLPAMAAPIRIYAAGSLSSAMQALIEASGLPADAFAKPVFGPAGLLGSRLRAGEEADLFASADLTAPESVAESRPNALIVPFVRNRMCVAAKPSLALTPSNMLDRMLSPDVRLATSTPVADPGGDYALAVFKRAEAMKSGAEANLKAKMLTLVGGPATMVPVAGKSPSATIFLADQADMFLYYCSSAAGLLKEVPDLTNLPVPDGLEVHPTYGLGVFSMDAGAQRFALFILSRKGQAILARFGFEPLAP